LLWIGQAHHAQRRDAQPGQAREDGDQERDLQGYVPGLGVDPDDLVLGCD